MKIVLLVNLPLNSAVHAESDNKRIILAGRVATFMIDVLQSILQLLNLAPCSLLFFVDRILKVTAQTLDLLDLLAQVTAQAGKAADDVGLNLTRLVGFGKGVSVEVLQDARRVGKAIV